MDRLVSLHSCGLPLDSIAKRQQIGTMVIEPRRDACSTVAPSARRNVDAKSIDGTLR